MTVGWAGRAGAGWQDAPHDRPDQRLAPLEVGDPAPAFALRNQYGETVSLEDFRGEKHVLLVFFPFAFSGVCTGEFREIREHLEDFEGDDVQVLGISCDPMESLRAWADRRRTSSRCSATSGRTARPLATTACSGSRPGSPSGGRSSSTVTGVIRWTLVNGPGEARDFDGYRAALAELRSATASV